MIDLLGNFYVKRLVCSNPIQEGVKTRETAVQKGFYMVKTCSGANLPIIVSREVRVFKITTDFTASRPFLEEDICLNGPAHKQARYNLGGCHEIHGCRTLSHE